MNFSCPISGCFSEKIIRRGRYFRKDDAKWIGRYRCTKCLKNFSSATVHPHFKQRRREITKPCFSLLCSGVSQRRVARLLDANPKTVVRRFRFLAHQARLTHADWLAKRDPVTDVQMDDLETSEHSKCKPISISLAVDAKHRKILGFVTSTMPAKGHLAKIAREKYPFRKDTRSLGWKILFEGLKKTVHPRAKWCTDQNPHYPAWIQKMFPDREIHLQVKGRRGCIAGQGELKKIGFDPLFSLNHTCAMMRANMNRLFRRTWCTTKNIQGLNDHLAIYTVYHNLVLTESRQTLRN